MRRFGKKKAIFLTISLIFFVIPFFWLKPGEMDLGGDSNRLYFYDPMSNLSSFAFYSVVPWGTGIVAYNQYFIPFLLFTALIKFFFHSPTIVIDIFNGFKLTGSFVFMFLLIAELAKRNKSKETSLAQWVGALVGSLAYTFSPSVLDNMKYALVTHNQVFLNPLLFYLLLKALKDSSIKYMWIALIITVFFSTNFSLQAPPPLFAFWPLALMFLLLYNFFVLKKSFPWKGAVLGFVLFLALHAFHLVPVATNIFDTGSEFNTRVFEGLSKDNTGLDYFSAIAPSGKVSKNIFFPLDEPQILWSLIFFPLLMILGLLSLKKKNITVLLLGIFFLITLFLASANITHIGFEFYKLLFYIPGFGMFRNFYGQWQFVYGFFYSIFLGVLASIFFSRVKKKYVYIISFIAISLLFLRSSIVFNGEIVNAINRTSRNVKTVIQVDPNYEKMLSYIRNIADDGRILELPFTDYGYNIVGGSNGGVYIGQSMTSFLIGRNDFAGYQNIAPFSETFVKLAKEKNYPLIKFMMSLLQVRYILYNSDIRVSSVFFPSFPYALNGIPYSPDGLKSFVSNIADKKIYQIGNYSLFEVDKRTYLPHFIIASKLLPYNFNPKYNNDYARALSFFPSNVPESSDWRIAFIERNSCLSFLRQKECAKREIDMNSEDVTISFQKINPTKYKLTITHGKTPFLLVFQNKYSSHWKLYLSSFSLWGKTIQDTYFDGKIKELSPEHNFFDSHPFETNGKKSFFDNQHIVVNEYANAWYIDPHGEIGSLNLIVEMSSQKTFYYYAIISAITFSVLISGGILLFIKRNKWYDNIRA